MLNSDGTRSLIHCGGGGSHTFGNDQMLVLKLVIFNLVLITIKEL